MGEIKFDSQGKVYVDCSVCGTEKAIPSNGLCRKCLWKYNNNKINIDCPAVKKMREDQSK